ncbi:transketolase [Chloroflexota bacterium]
MSMKSENKPDASWLAYKANELRILALEMALRAGGGHLGGAFSVIDVITALYFRILNHDPKNPSWPERDRLLFSKGHSCLALYTALAETGYFEKERLERFCVDDGLLAGHPERELVPGVEITAGSLAHGLPIAVGMALAAKIDKKEHKIYAVLSDGECNEGSTWEAIMSGAQLGLDNLTLIIDNNRFISLGPLAEIMNVEPLGDRMRDFGWGVEVIDGHDMGQIVSALEKIPFEAGKPSVIVSNTVKGKGVSFMENVAMWHYRGMNEEEAEIASRELKEALGK